MAKYTYEFKITVNQWMMKGQDLIWSKTISEIVIEWEG